METKKGCEGCQDCTCAPVSIARSTPKIVSYPALCTHCVDMYRTFNLPGHQDDGERFLCGICADNMKAGNFNFHCSYFSKKKIAPIIDAEQEQKKSYKFGHFAGSF